MNQHKHAKEEYKEKLKELESAKEVEYLKLRLKYSEETKGLELQIKDLQRELAEKKVTVGELEKKKLRQQLEEQQKKITTGTKRTRRETLRTTKKNHSRNEKNIKRNLKNNRKKDWSNRKNWNSRQKST